jgi:hypothetical protein
MPDNQDRPTSQHVVKEASTGGIGISTKDAKQLSSSGKAAKDKRKDNSAEKAKTQGGSSKDQAK